MKDLPGFVENAVNVSNAAFAELQTGPKTFKILDDLAAQPDMTVEETRALKTHEIRRTGGG